MYLCFIFQVTVSFLTHPERKMDEIEVEQKYGSVQHILVTKKKISVSQQTRLVETLRYPNLTINSPFFHLNILLKIFFF